ncbi:MAG TPA: xanthine dehydrogenase family protein molybdopterin-binding subunit [Syntrophomonadaceae bacterium]|nr:xanthine dehydrogenase family protein molybdopterin-binding subunit [Syntrophomonadaceae bacterium]
MEFLSIGKDVIRKDAWEKVTGRATYSADVSSPGILHGVLVTSTCAHGKIKSIDYVEASNMPGVKAVLTGDYYPILTGSVLEDHPPLAAGKVRYYGEPVAIVVARSEAEASAAATRIKVYYEKLPTVDSPSAAIKPDSPLVHEHLDQYKKAIPEVYPEANSNIVHLVKIRKGDMNQGWMDSDITVEGTYSLPYADHIAMETRSARAEILPDEQIVIHTSSQSPFAVRKLISQNFGVDLGKVVVHVPLVGGGYGGKAAVQLEYLAVMASQAVGGQPVMITNTREQDMAGSPSKLALEAIVKLGAKKNGTLTAGEYTFIVGTGAYADSGPRMTNSMAMSCTGPYKLDNVWCDAYCVYTNHTYATSFRGFGHTSCTFAVERTMDKLAALLNIDPLELRRKNAITPGETTPTQVVLTPSNLGDVPACLDKLKMLINWDEGVCIDMGNSRIRAKGVACLWKTSNSPTDAFASAVVTFNSDGSANLQVGAVEIGPSTRTTLAQILAERLRLDIDRIHIDMEVNTRTSPHDWKTVASMSTFLVGRAVEEAANDAIRQILSLAAMAIRCSPEDLALDSGRVYVKDNPNFYVDYATIVHGFKYPNGNTVGSQVIGRGTYVMPHLSPMDRETGKGKPGPYLTPGAQAVEIELNTADYTYRILKAATVLDAGKVLNPKSARGLVMGAMGMGLGLGSRESFIYDQQQELQNTSLRTYKVLRIGEQPEYLVNWVETPNAIGPYGARGLAEHGIIGIHAALVNALSRAAGVELDQVPVIPELIWEKIEESKP